MPGTSIDAPTRDAEFLCLIVACCVWRSAVATSGGLHRHELSIGVVVVLAKVEVHSWEGHEKCADDVTNVCCDQGPAGIVSNGHESTPKWMNLLANVCGGSQLQKSGSAPEFGNETGLMCVTYVGTKHNAQRNREHVRHN